MRTGVGPGEIKKWVGKREKKVLREAGFLQIALKGWGNGRFSWLNFDH